MISTDGTGPLAPAREVQGLDLGCKTLSQDLGVWPVPGREVQGTVLGSSAHTELGCLVRGPPGPWTSGLDSLVISTDGTGPPGPAREGACGNPGVR